MLTTSSSFGGLPEFAQDAMYALHAAVDKVIGRTHIVLMSAPSVTLVDPFDGGLLDFVPAYRDDKYGFRIFDEEKRRYLETNPLAHVSYLHASGTYTRTLVRMLKSWKYAHCREISSIYLELFCASWAASFATGDLLDDLIAMFERLNHEALTPFADPTSSRQKLLHAVGDQASLLAAPRVQVKAGLEMAWRIDWAVRSGASKEGRSYAKALLIHPAYFSYYRKRMLQRALVDGKRPELRVIPTLSYMERIEQRRERSKWTRPR